MVSLCHLCCSGQNVILKGMELDENIACNLALRENVFMMVVCISLKIPLFLVGKPGTSKSLAKNLVNDSMKEKGSTCDLLKEFKEVVLKTCTLMSCEESCLFIL